MKVLFVFPNILKYENISFGIGSLSAYLQRQGHQTALIDFTYSMSKKRALKKVIDFQPDLIAFSTTTGDFLFSCRLAEYFKGRYPAPIIFGGVHPTIEPEESIRHPAVDMICVGEGEEALRELLDRLPSRPEGIGNIWFKDGGEVVRNPVRPLIDDLDALPVVDRELFEYEKLLPLRAYEGQLMVGRGCPYGCSYCINPVLQEIYRGRGRFVRHRSVENVIAEAKDLVSRYPVKCIYFCDDVFVLNRQWLEEFCSVYRREIGLPFRCQARPEMINAEVCRTLKEAGCFNMQMGIEAGNQRIRNEVLKRKMSNRKIVEAARDVREAGLTLYAYNMIGLPYETEAEIRETIELNRRIKPDFMQTSIFQPYPGTGLKAICEREGWLTAEPTRIRSNKFSSIVEYPELSARMIRRYKRRFRYLVYRDENRLKALVILLFDSNYRLLTALRAVIPQWVRGMVNRLIYKLNTS
jgi:anaerobic magnesium-protoporphyrin IX monomethyl ester cyclase